MQSSFSKAVILVIDALRYDYLVWRNNLHQPEPNQNKLPIIHYLLEKEAEHSFLFNGVADPPSVKKIQIFLKIFFDSSISLLIAFFLGDDATN